MKLLSRLGLYKKEIFKVSTSKEHFRQKLEVHFNDKLGKKKPYKYEWRSDNEFQIIKESKEGLQEGDTICEGIVVEHEGKLMILSEFKYRYNKMALGGLLFFSVSALICLALVIGSYTMNSFPISQFEAIWYTSMFMIAIAYRYLNAREELTHAKVYLSRLFLQKV